MRLPLQISFHNVPSSPAVEEVVRAKAAQLDRFSPDVISCRVVIDQPHKHHQSGNRYQVRLDLKVRGEEIAVTRESADHVAVGGLTSTIHDAFDAADRLLEDAVRRQHHRVKHHDPVPHARVRVVLPGQDHGFLEAADGHEVYFHRNSLVGADFDALVPGTEVSFVEEAGEKGLQASTVHVRGRHGHGE